jgi:hypothetical protein
MTDDSGKGRNVSKGMSENMGNIKGKKSRSKSKSKGVDKSKSKCFICHNHITSRRIVLGEREVVILQFRFL